MMTCLPDLVVLVVFGVEGSGVGSLSSGFGASLLIFGFAVDFAVVFAACAYVFPGCVRTSGFEIGGGFGSPTGRRC